MCFPISSGDHGVLDGLGEAAGSLNEVRGWIADIVVDHATGVPFHAVDLYRIRQARAPAGAGTDRDQMSVPCFPGGSGVRGTYVPPVGPGRKTGLFRAFDPRATVAPAKPVSPVTTHAAAANFIRRRAALPRARMNPLPHPMSAVDHGQ